LIFRNTSIEQLTNDEPERRFDAVVASEVLEHVDNPQFFVATCASLLNPGETNQNGFFSKSLTKQGYCQSF
jgi:2-polyprenyl-3-methyl-5-hydroxy-6-metoxy-1,4-benzoquinol methylase